MAHLATKQTYFSSLLAGAPQLKVVVPRVFYIQHACR